jgi:hypothetical protein
VLVATLDVVSEGGFDGSLGGRRGEGHGGRVDAALDGALRDLPSDLETAAASTDIQRNYSGPADDQWTLQGGEPGRLAGAVEGAGELSVPTGAFEPRFLLRSRGQWSATRVAQTLCPWRGSVVVSGAFGNQETHEEQLELTFRPTGDGQLEGDGVGEATIRGGPPGGCDYSGGGPFAVQVLGEERAGLFRLRLEDYEQPQLVITTTCAGGRFTAPQPTLSTLFGTIELPQAVGARAHVTLPDSLPDARGTLDVSISPLMGADPP